MSGPHEPGENSGYVAPPPFAAPPYFPPPDSRPPAGYGYPPPAQPGYRYPVYAAPPGYLAVPDYDPPPEQVPLAFGMIAAGLAGLGSLLLLVALIGLAWFTSNGQNLTTGDIRNLLDSYGDLASGLSVAYFSWLCWVLLLLAAGCAAGAALPMAGLSLAFRIAGPIVAGFSVLLTFGAIELQNSLYTGDDYPSYFDHLSTGFWVAVVGFCLIGAGSIVGPRKLATPAVTVR